jgi:pimeloyl-ACP methyl ester carboxylesterase
MVAVRRADRRAPAVAAAAPVAPGRAEQSRARYPDRTGFVERTGVRSFFEVYGDGDPAILFVPTWSIVHARIWKAQIPWFAGRHRVITFDAVGNGRSDRPPVAEAYAERALAEDIIRVLDETATERAILVSLSLGAQRSLVAAAGHPDRVTGVVFIAPAVPLGKRLPGRGLPFDEPLDIEEGWARYNAHSWRRDYAGFLEFFFGQAFTEAHSTKQTEDAVGWGLETDPETLILTEHAPGLSRDETLALCGRIRCPVLVIQGSDDSITGPQRGIELAAAIPGARLEIIEGGGHIQNARDPVRTNLLLRDFIRALEAQP